MRHFFVTFFHRKALFKRSLFFVILCVLFSFSGCAVHRKGPWVHKVDSEEASRVVLLYATELEHDKRLHLEDSFISYDDQIYKFHLEFITQQILDIKTARELLVETTEGLLEKINGSLELRGDVFELPFTAKNLEIVIYPETFYGKYVDERKVGWIVLKDGVTCFYAFDSFDKTKDFWHSRSEYYYQSRDIVKYQREGEKKYKDEKGLVKPNPLKQEQYDPSNAKL